MTSRSNPARSRLRPEVADLYPTQRGRPVSFAAELDDQLLGERVLVQAKKGHRFEGDLVRIQHRNRHVLLTDVEERPSGTKFPRVFAPQVDWIVQLPVDQSPSFEP